MAFDLSIPTPSGLCQITVNAGSSVIFVGANGGGKTRLAVMIEESLSLNAHRISAHRALALNPTIAKISEASALRGLRTGYPEENATVALRVGQRWRGNMAVSLLNDFDFLIQALFADQANASLATHKQARAGVLNADPTKFERLDEIWGKLLPHRKLHITGDDILVGITGSDTRYKASDMSDGERAIFYMIGQVLAAAENSLLIVDEPELHVHRSIMSKLWDELEAARPDCGFVFITHDLEFASGRVAQKFAIRDYVPSPLWTLEPIHEHAGFSEEIATLILGSRRPILFVEGDENSIDQAIYRCCFPEWTVIPRGSCEEVIHSVATMRRNQTLTRVTCSGIVDADDYSADDITYLQRLGISVLSVSEIENVLLLPPVSRAIAQGEGIIDAELETVLLSLKNAIFERLNSDAAIDAAITRYCRRRIDRTLKKVDLSNASNIAELAEEYQRRTAELSIPNIAESAKSKILQALRTDDLPLLMANYDDKGLLSLAAQHLKKTRLKDFESWLTRVLINGKAPALVAAIRENLPPIQAA